MTQSGIVICKSCGIPMKITVIDGVIVQTLKVCKC